MGKPTGVNDDFSDYFTHGILTACWDIGLPGPFGAAVTHLDPYSPDTARKEAQYLGFTARRYQPFALIGGDFNYPPLYGPAPDLSRMSILNRARRFKDPLAESPEVRNTDVARQLADDHFHDAFALLHQATGDPQFTARTGKSDRIDWIVVTDALVPAVVSGRLLDTPEGAADHSGVAVTVDTALIDTSLAE
jgi:endonuclease/exonuclease/phosphatase family metal-dependent hydrolase